MLSTRPRPAHLPLIIPPPPQEYARSPSSCSTASSSSSSSSVVYSSSYPSSGSSFSSVQSSARSQDGQSDEQNPLRRKTSRPLPKIPVTPPISRSSSMRSVRPLPRPPSSEPGPSSSLTPPCSAVLDVPRQAPTSPRPLPIPTQSHLPLLRTVDRRSTITPSQAQRGLAPPPPPRANRHPFPNLSLRIDAPGRSTLEIVLESPQFPVSPIVFARPMTLFPGTTEDALEIDDEEMCLSPQEEEVAKKLGELGFVEMPGSDEGYRPPSVPSCSETRLPPPRWDSYHRKSSSQELNQMAKVDMECAAPPRRSEDDYVIRVELVPAQPAEEPTRQRRTSRASRLWVREKKGKRWVENDYFEVLNLLRKL
ncbi:hypothetical protein BDW22DRAFT_93752 [Trametopsis cervina]|nr:hypothetical protein BDW22DRAFT_93752 [Trametopsis cervina]